MKGRKAFPTLFFKWLAMADKKQKKKREDEEEIDTSIDWIAMAQDSIKPEYEANAS